MKFFHLLALVGVASAMKLSSHNTHMLSSIKHANKNALRRVQAKNFIKQRWENLTEEQEQEIEDWVVEELTTGEMTITKQEAHDAIVAFGEKHGFPPLPEEAWEALEAMFDEADLNGDGAIDLAELEAACS